jgi:hypothetical protein
MRRALLVCVVTAGLFLTVHAGVPVDERAIKNTNFFVPQPVNVKNTVTYNSTNVGGPQWDRPFADGTCCSSLGPVRYHVQAFSVDTAGAYNLSSVQDGGWDGYLFVYHTNFDPLNQSVNFVAGDDDGNGGIGTSDITGVALNPGTTYYLVTTAFQLGEEGTFTNTLSGPGIITLGNSPIPTLGDWGLISLVVLLGAAAVLALRSGRAV